ncbi:hypothetical protein L1987_34517 [Smallanthus sonchifolius]|uniref:Uncharacterized protein n=1 Tax=Smallanthus sonchifolius TaxID=185202 RepID=A0ACB9HWM5_9ASTR|nr:hypothetical protein L1987_34517 [Smallanthus sonchifolius]
MERERRAGAFGEQKSSEKKINREDIGKIDRKGNPFGFLRFNKVEDVDVLIEEVQRTRIGGAKLEVNVARFARGKNLPPPHINPRHQRKPQVGYSDPKVPPSHFHATMAGRKSFKDVVTGNSSGDPERLTVDLLVKLMPGTAVFGVAASMEIVNDIRSYLSRYDLPTMEVRYLGGLKLLLSFPSAKKAKALLDKDANGCYKIFDHIELWEGQPFGYDRVAWISIRGVPLQLWNNHTFDSIGNKLGRVIHHSTAEPTDENLAFDRIAILIQSGEKHAAASWSTKTRAITYGPLVDENLDGNSAKVNDLNGRSNSGMEDENSNDGQTSYHAEMEEEVPTVEVQKANCGSYSQEPMENEVGIEEPCMEVSRPMHGDKEDELSEHVSLECGGGSESLMQSSVFSIELLPFNCSGLGPNKEMSLKKRKRDDKRPKLSQKKSHRT